MPESSVKIGYLILAHENSEHVARMVRILKQGNSRIVLHLDASIQGQQRLDFLANVREAGEIEEARAVACHWGDWSLVEATLAGLEQFRNGGSSVSHVVLLSGSHFPVRSPHELEVFLQSYPKTDFIEAHDALEIKWAQSGMNLERFQFFFPLNGRTHPWAFELVTSLQKRVGVKRNLPEQLRPFLGSQWWCLRMSTCERVLDFLKQHPRVKRYFKSTWIPDESFFQTLVANLCDSSEVANVPFVYHALTPKGRPYVFHNDHDLLLTEKKHHFFARKISPQAGALFRALEERVTGKDRSDDLETTPTLLSIESKDLASKIKAYYQFYQPLPGHIDDNYLQLFLNIEHPVYVILGDTFSEARSEHLARAISGIPEIQFLGRSFSKDNVDFSGVMEELGLGEKSFEIRDRHTCQLFHEYFSRKQKGVVLLVDPDLDFESWQSFCNLKNYIPILATDPDTPRYQQAAFLERAQKHSWGEGARAMNDIEIASFIRKMSSKGSLTEAVALFPDRRSDTFISQPGEANPPCSEMMVRRNIFFLWDAGLEKAPLVVWRAYYLWKFLNPEWTVHFFDEQRMNEMISDWPKPLQKATIQAKSNALRIEMLHRHGGVWVDATLIPTKPLDQWIDLAARDSGFFAFRLAQPSERLLDSWFLASAYPGNPIVSRWRERCLEFWEDEWLVCDPGSKIDNAYRKLPMGVIPEVDPSRPVEYPYHWMHYLFNRLYQEDDVVKRLWDETPFWLAKNCLLPPRHFHAGNFEKARNSFLEDDAPVKKMGRFINWPEELINSRSDMIIRRYEIELQSAIRDRFSGSGLMQSDVLGMEKKRFALLTYARSGSNLMIDLLNQITGVRCHGEVFKKERIELDEDVQVFLPDTVEIRNKRPVEFLGKLFEFTEAKAVGFKLFPSHNKAVEEYVIESDSVAKIILRRNVFDTFISLQRARATGTWVEKKESLVCESPKFLFDPDEFNRHYDWHQNYYRRLDDHAKRRPDSFLLVDYEEVVDLTAFDKVCLFLGIPSPPLESLIINLKKQTTEEIEDLVSNFEDMEKYLQSEYAEIFLALKKTT